MNNATMKALESAIMNKDLTSVGEEPVAEVLKEEEVNENGEVEEVRKLNADEVFMEMIEELEAKKREKQQQ